MREQETNDQTGSACFTPDELERLMSFRAAISAGLYGDESVDASTSHLAKPLCPLGAEFAAEAGFTPGDLARLIALKAAVKAGFYSEGRTFRAPFNRGGES